mgnify:FL=1
MDRFFKLQVYTYMVMDVRSAKRVMEKDLYQVTLMEDRLTIYLSMS